MMVRVDGEKEMSEKKCEDEFHRETLLTVTIRREKELQYEFEQAILDADTGDEITDQETIPDDDIIVVVCIFLIYLVMTTS